jgi:hypothetical protein
MNDFHGPILQRAAGVERPSRGTLEHFPTKLNRGIPKSVTI